MNAWFWLSPLLAASVLACGGAPEAQEAATSAETLAIVGGDESTSDGAVVMLRTTFASRPGDKLCTGTILAPSLVLTALRCVAPLEPGSFTCEPDGSLAPPDSGGGWFGSLATPSEVRVHLGPRAAQTEPAAYGATIFGSGSLEACIDDIALVVLDRDLPFPGLPLRLEGVLSPGNSVDVVGFGDTGMSNNPFVRSRRNGLHVLAVGPADTSQGEPTVIPRTFLTDDGLCAGDVGGPALAPGTGAVVGVYSRVTVNASCYAIGQTHVFMHVAPYASLIREAFAAVGAEPVEEGADALAKRQRSAACSSSLGRADPGGAAMILLAALALVRMARAKAEQPRRRAVCRPTAG